MFGDVGIDYTFSYLCRGGRASVAWVLNQKRTVIFILVWAIAHLLWKETGPLHQLIKTKICTFLRLTGFSLLNSIEKQLQSGNGNTIQYLQAFKIIQYNKSLNWMKSDWMLVDWSVQALPWVVRLRVHRCSWWQMVVRQILVCALPARALGKNDKIPWTFACGYVFDFLQMLYYNFPSLHLRKLSNLQWKK